MAMRMQDLPWGVREEYRYSVFFPAGLWDWERMASYDQTSRIGAFHKYNIPHCFEFSFTNKYIQT